MEHDCFFTGRVRDVEKMTFLRDFEGMGLVLPRRDLHEVPKERTSANLGLNPRTDLFPNLVAPI